MTSYNTPGHLWKELGTPQQRHIYVHCCDSHHTEEMQPASMSMKGWV